jgi:hypothetical protein
MLIGRRRRKPPAGATEIAARTGPPRAGLVSALLTAALLVVGQPVPSMASAAEPAATAAPPSRAAPNQPPPPEFVPPPECQAQHAALLAVKQRIDAHNARPHLFRLPAQAAQAAAYDAEAGQLNSAQQAAVANLEICLQNAARTRALAALAGAGPDGPPVQTTAPDNVRRQLDEAKRNVRPGWMPPPAPAPGDRWQVDARSPVRPMYDVLRKRNPGDIGDVRLRGVPRPRADDPDPADPGSTVGRRTTGSVNASPDHIISLAELVQTPGFTLLSPDNMYAVANAPLNLQWLSGRANVAKSSRSAADIPWADAQWKRDQRALEDEVRAQLRDLITFLVYSQGER